MKPHREPPTKYRPRWMSSPPSHSPHRSITTPLGQLQRYDVHTGQVFREIEVRATTRPRTDWIGELQTPRLVKKRLPNADGARSLFDMAKGTVARHMSSIRPHHLSDVPWGVAEHVWNEITAIHAESFHAWRTLAAAYPEHFHRAGHRYLIDIKQPRLPVADYYRGIASMDLKWLTCLRIAPREILLADVVRIATITNLAVLDLSDGNATEASQSAIDERVFKTWSELAVQGAFSHLRVLLLGWQEAISKWLFQYLDTFPSLCSVIVTDSLQIHQRNRAEWDVEAAHHGWLARSSKQSAKRLRPLLDDKQFYLGSVSGCYASSQELFDPRAPDQKPEPGTGLPVMECWLGRPKVWAHVVDEYPGTRTVWFDKAKTKSSRLNHARGPPAQEPEPRDPTKRSRDRATPATELRSPPSKRTTAQRKIQRCSATDLLAELGHR